MKRYTVGQNGTRVSDDGKWMKAADVLELLASIETVQQTNNCSPECPVCAGMQHMGGHQHECTLGRALYAAQMNDMDIQSDDEHCPCGGRWRIDGQHSNEFCSKCFKSKPQKVADRNR